MTYSPNLQNRIVFLGNFTKTDFFRLVASQMDRRRTRVSWIVVNAQQRDILLQDYPVEDVLYLPLSTPETRTPYPVKINDLVFADRRLKHIMPKGLRYLRAIQAPIVDFLEGAVPTLVVGELTYSYEVLTFRLIQQVLPKARWVSPFLTRVPAGHFAFFADEAFSREVYLAPSDLPEANLGGEDDVDYREMNRKHIAHQGSTGFYAEKVGTFLSLKNYDPEDPTWKSNTRLDKIKKNLAWMANRLSYRRVPKSGIEAIDACKGNSVIFPLHLQPELNIDTCGRYWDNQAETILKIWRQLGPDDKLFIKEHPVAIGNRGAGWYRRLLAYPNLELLHHAAPVDKILRKIDYVFTISGTMGLEAALMGGKVLCLAPTTYDRLENVVSPTISDLRGAQDISTLYANLQADKKDGWTQQEYAEHLEQHAFIGDPEGDHIANPGSWQPHNIGLVKQAFEHVLAQLETTTS
ncbi:hypothetical protein [Kordiimonas sp.]|uniref:capsular polysaccharide export protein, LipB/KpsS family n=1 Tax=Kordiimonas sp. TaxID=1970157 RepID=UPI003A93BAF5